MFKRETNLLGSENLKEAIHTPYTPVVAQTNHYEMQIAFFA